MLDEVRPYLIADGGNVRVMGVDVESRVVSDLWSCTWYRFFAQISAVIIGSILSFSVKILKLYRWRWSLSLALLSIKIPESPRRCSESLGGPR